jgi:hypothetical protein
VLVDESGPDITAQRHPATVGISNIPETVGLPADRKTYSEIILGRPRTTGVDVRTFGSRRRPARRRWLRHANTGALSI